MPSKDASIYVNYFDCNLGVEHKFDFFSFFFTIPNLSFKIHSNAFFVEVKSVSKIN